MSTSEQAYQQSTLTGIRNRLSRTRSVYDLGFSRPDDRFIPIAPADLINLIAEDSDLFGEHALKINGIATLVTRILEQEKAAFERTLEEAYSHFNPDRETVEIEGITERRQVEEDSLHRKLGHMLDKANFERLSPEQFEAAIAAGNTHGLKVQLDLNRVDEVSVWVRGRSETDHQQRTFTHPVRGIKTKIATFNRLVIVVSLHGDDDVHIRMFKNIPIRDVEALLPHAKVKMNRKDALFMVGGGAGAAWSVVTKLAIVGAAAITNLLWVLALPLAILSWKLFSGYRRALKDRNSHRAQHLYLQSLGNNRSAIHTIATMICEEEIKEAVLLYAFCTPSVRGKLKPNSLRDLERLIQNYMQESIGAKVDFDIADASETLDRLGLWVDVGGLITLSFEDSVNELEEHWTELRSEHYHARLLGVTE